MDNVEVDVAESSESQSSKIEILRGIITEKLNTSLMEILALVETTIDGYDKEVSLLKRQLENHKRQLDSNLHPDVKIEGNDDTDGDDGKPTLKQEYQGAVTTVSSVPYPINTESTKDVATNTAQKVKIRGQSSVETTTCQQNPRESEFFCELSVKPELTENSVFEAFLSDNTERSDDQATTSGLPGTEPEPMDDQNNMCFSGSAPQNTGALDCKLCGLLFNSKSILTKHVVNYHLDNPKVICGVCGLHLVSPEELKNHLQSHMKLLKCDKCKRYFITSFSFQKHSVVCQTGQRAHVDDTLLKSLQKNYNCQQCGKNFFCDKLLRQHEKMHSDMEKDYLRVTCNKAFYTVNKLISRQTRKPAIFKCPVCNKLLTGNLERHMRIHTGEKPFSCTECGTKFRTHDHLKNHMDIHLGIKPFSCTECDYKCARKEHLEVHLRKHTGHKPYRCSLCNMGFTQSHSLKTHMKSQH